MKISISQPESSFATETLLETKCISGFSADEIHGRLATDGVIAFRDQNLDDQEMIALLNRLGEITFTQGERPVVGHPDLNVVSNVGKKSPKSVFHSDTSYVRNTPAYTVLRPIELPERGGATLFTNQYLAWQCLPQSVQQKLAGADALHIVSGLDPETLTETSAWHPVAREHPRSGRLALYLTTPERCKKIRHVETGVLADSHRMIQLLYRHSTRRCPVYRHEWQINDVVIWDNRCTMHRGDHRGMAIDVSTTY